MLDWRPTAGARLRLAGQFSQFQSFEEGGFGAARARSVILGRLETGEPVTLLNAAEVSSAFTGRDRHPRAVYGVELVLRRSHVRSWQDLTFGSLWFRLDDLPRCIAATSFDWSAPIEPGVHELRYRDKPTITFQLGEYRVSLLRWANETGKGDTRGLREFAACSVHAPRETHYSTLLAGPVATMRRLFEFSSLKRLEITEVRVGRGRLGTGFDELLFPAMPSEPENDSPMSERMFTVEELGQEHFGQVANAWHSARSELSPALDLFSQLVGRHELALELRFLTLVYILEAFHRRTAKPQRADAEAEAAIQQTMKCAPKLFAARINGLLRQLSSPALRDRLADLAKTLPDPFVHIGGAKGAFFKPVGPGRDFISEVVDTRNFLTHLSRSKRARILTGNALFTACVRLEWMFRFLLLVHLGFTRTEANGYVISSSLSGLPGTFSTLLEHE